VLFPAPEGPSIAIINLLFFEIFTLPSSPPEAIIKF
jgi:hypothetical protein